MKDQIGDVLAELMEIKKNGLEVCGISSDTIEERAVLWHMIFQSDSFFSLSADEFWMSLFLC